MRRRHNAGFTLVELLVVVAIVAILAAMAMPQFRFRDKAFDARVMADLRNAVTGQEVYFSDNLTYSSSCTTLPGFALSAGNSFSACTGNSTSYVMTITNPQADKACTWDNAANPKMSCS